MRKYVFLLLLLLAFSSCSHEKREANKRFMTFDDVEYVTSFPKTIELSSPQKVGVDILSLNGFSIQDSYLMILAKGDGFFAICSKDNDATLGRFLNVGHSEEEFLYPPTMETGFTFYHEGDSLFADVFDNQKGRILTVDVQKSIANKKLSLRSIKKGLSTDVFTVFRLPDGKYFVKELSNGDTQQIRMVRDLKTGKNTTPAVLNRLNDASIKQNEDFNILSTVTKMSKDGRIIEMPVGLNYLNVYKLDGSFAKTICVGDKLDDIDDIMDKSRWSRLYTFSDVRVFDNFFGVVQINEEEKLFQSKRTKLPSILLFSLDGKPLAEIKMKRQITSFDIDMQKGCLYTFDSESGEFLRYNFSKELKAIK